MKVSLDVRVRAGGGTSFIRTSELQEAALRAVGIEPRLWSGGPVDTAVLWSPLVEPSPVSNEVRQILTLHDFAALQRDPRSAISRWWRGQRFRRRFLASARVATAFAAVSKDAARAAQQSFGGQLPPVGVVPHFAASTFRPPTAEESEKVLGEFGLKPGYLLFVAALRRGKNWDGLVRAWAALPSSLRDRHPLVLVGGMSRARRPLERLTKRLSVSDRVFALGPVGADRLRALYGNCRLFAFPSYHEGFGLPPLEAMACGAPVIASTTTAMPEVLGDAAVYANPWVEGELGARLAELLAAPERLDSMRAASLARAAEFNPQRTGEAFLALCERLDLQR